MNGKIFFIVGVQRSGTTLLQKLLSNHPDVLMQKRSIAFRIITCFKNLYDLLPFNVKHDKNEFLKWLIKNDENGRLKKLIDYKNIEKYKNIRDLIQKSIHKKINLHGKKIWGDKSPNLQHYLNDIMLLIPEAKIIHIVRDGRANTYSTSTRSYRNIELSAQEWVDGNIFGLVNQDILGKENYKILKYENLLSQPQNELQSICEFLGIPFVDSMMDLSIEKTSDRKSYVKSFFDTSKINKWKEQFSLKEIKKIEKIQGELLMKFGYQLENEIDDFKNISLRRRIFLNQKDNVKLLFKKKRIGMKEQELVELNLSFKSRLYTFLSLIFRDFTSLPIFKSLFSRYFFKEKYFKK